MASQGSPSTQKVSPLLIRRWIQQTECEVKTLKAKADKQYEKFIAEANTIPSEEPGKIIVLRHHTIVKMNMFLDAQTQM